MLRRAGAAKARFLSISGVLGLSLALSGCIKKGTASHAALSEGPGAPGVADESRSLREAAKKSGRKLGVALATWFFQQPNYQETAAKHFDSLTAENEMKWYAIEPEPGKFRFEAGEKLVSFAEQHGMRVRGHTLVWHSQLAPWVKDLKGAELHAAMLRHAKTTVSNWKGRIAQWDVVNEAIGENGEPRADSPFTALGPTYIDDAFRAAHEADPSARLYYNDYEIEDHRSAKSQSAFELVKRLKGSGVPIHGVGFQMHMEPRNWPSADVMQQTFEKFAALDLEIELTEIDVPMGSLAGTESAKLAQQAELTRGIFRACLAVPKCVGLTLWGLTDAHSWLSTPEWAKLRGPGVHAPLPFDKDYRAKPMFQAIFETLSGGPSRAQ